VTRRAFTLLESIVALTILAMVAGACLELRANALANTRTLAGKQEDARFAHTLFDLALAGFLPSPQRLDPEDPESARVWTGTRDGRDYRILKERVVVTNPVRASVTETVAGVYPQNAALYRYTLEVGGETYTMEWAQ